MLNIPFIIFLSCSFLFMTACGSSSKDNNIPPEDNTQGFTSNMRLFGGGLQMCGIGQDKQVYCWGKDYHGELGQAKDIPNGSETYLETSTLAPTKVNGLPDIETMDADYGRTCAVDDGGSAWCWGSDFISQNPSYIPEITPQLNSVVGITVSPESICATRQSVDLLCWGDNPYGHLNVGDSSEQVKTPSPFNWGQLEKTDRIAMASGSSCLLTNGGVLYCLGYNPSGALGTGSDAEHITEPEAVIISEGQRFSEISAGFDHFCALGTDKNAYCWGYYLGVESFVNTPSKVLGVTGIKKMTSFFEGSCALTQSGEVWCWGKNDSGMLGYKAQTGDYWINQAVKIELPGKAMDIASAEYFNCAIGDESFNDDIFCWGSIANEHYLSTASIKPERKNYSPITLQSYTPED